MLFIMREYYYILYHTWHIGKVGIYVESLAKVSQPLFSVLSTLKCKFYFIRII